MKKETLSKTEKPKAEDDLRPEYDLKELLRGGERGKYAEQYRMGTNVVVLDPDVSKAFPNGDAVNRALRLVMQLVQIPKQGTAQTTEEQPQVSLFESAEEYDAAQE